VERQKATLRSAASHAESPLERLTRKQTLALAGEMYRGWVAEDRRTRIAVEHDAAHGGFRPVVPEHFTAAEWASVIAHWAGMVDRAEEMEADPLPPPATLEALLGPIADRVLAAHGYGRLDAPSRQLFLEYAWQAFRDAATFEHSAISRRDYTPDPKAASYPAIERRLVTIGELVEGWAAERKPRKATVMAFTSALADLAKFLQHDDATRITTDDIIRWKDHLVGSGRLAVKTITEGYLAPAKAVLGWGAANRKLKANPVAGVVVKAKKAPRTRPKGFTDAEAKLILQAALQAATPSKALAKKQAAARRWIPWLCCYTGARVSEIAQLRAEDIRQEGGVWHMVLTPEAGAIKSDHFRVVPLHPDLIRQGFLKHVEAAGPGPLFYDPSAKRKEEPRKPPAQTVANKIAAWVRDIGMKDPRVAPNHGWRHRFATECRRYGVAEGAEMILKGHAPKTVGEGYGDWPLEVLARELAKLPAVKV